jgi:hypothetical protein
MVPTVPALDFEHVYWVAKRGKFHGFAKSPETMKPGEIGEIVEYEVVGIVKDSFLRGGFQAHTIVVQIDPSHIEQIKAIVRTLPNFTESPSYHWPIENQLDAKFTSKVDVNDDFAAIWDGRKIDVHDVGSRVGLSMAEIEEGAKVLVEYAITPYVGRKARAGVEPFPPGTTLQLLSIGFLKDPDRRFDVESPRKKRRMA